MDTYAKLRRQVLQDFKQALFASKEKQESPDVPDWSKAADIRDILSNVVPILYENKIAEFASDLELPFRTVANWIRTDALPNSKNRTIMLLTLVNKCETSSFGLHS